MDLKELDVENVLLYIGDAVRFDSLHPDISSQGMTYKTISQSIHTPPSFSSIFSGCIPPRHGVYWFRDTLPNGLETLLTLTKHETEFVHTDSSLQRTTGGLLAEALNAEEATLKGLEEMNTPFVWTERGPGGHAPYGEKPMKNAKEYFDHELPASESYLKSEYRGAIQRDYREFQKRLKILKEQGLADDTLVIFASDHGEMLGEQGIIGHNGPILPEVAYTPTVFIHSSLPDEFGGTIRNIDLFPTIRSLLGYSELSHVDGAPVWELSEPVRGTVHYSHGFDLARNFGEKIASFRRFVNPTYDQHGVFDANGGYVKRFNSTYKQFQILAGNLTLSSMSPQYRRHPWKTTRSFMHRDWICGAPQFSEEEAHKEIQKARARNRIGNTGQSDVEKEQLEALGYL